MTITLNSGVQGDAAERRRYVLLAHQSVIGAYASACADGQGGSALVDELFWAGERLRREYLALLPIVRLSRCPWTGESVDIPIDTYDVDGLWWAYQTPLRELGSRPTSLVALTGALRLADPIADPPFLVKPGPEAPYVLPRLLEDEGVAAVITQVAIGPHTGYVIAYFAQAPESTVVRANEWGANGFARIDVDGSLEWGAVPEEPAALDFSLEPWIDQGRVLWVDPADAELELRRGLEGCPYVGLPGGHEVIRLGEGVRP